MDEGAGIWGIQTMKTPGCWKIEWSFDHIGQCGEVVDGDEAPRGYIRVHVSVHNLIDVLLDIPEHVGDAVDAQTFKEDEDQRLASGRDVPSVNSAAVDVWLMLSIYPLVWAGTWTVRQ